MVGLSAISPVGLGLTPTSAKQPGQRNGLNMRTVETIAQLGAVDQHVRAHEQAHLAAAGPYATGAPSYSYTVGPDGKLYAVGGEVSLDISPDPSSPENTIQKARTIQAAANAPLDPSSQDRMVAAAAAQMEEVAQREITEQRHDAYAADVAEGDFLVGRLVSVVF